MVGQSDWLPMMMATGTGMLRIGSASLQAARIPCLTLKAQAVRRNMAIWQGFSGNPPGRRHDPLMR
jgi:hypothetical protein